MIHNTPHIEVGILFSGKIHFRLNGTYYANNQAYEGEYYIIKENSKYLLQNADGTQ